MKDLVAYLAASTSVLAGLWLGEHRSSILPLESIAVLGLLVLGTVALRWRRHRGGALGSGLAVTLLFVLPWLAGASEASYAFNDCVARGEEVREALHDYEARTGQYPARLSELTMHLPGQLVLPPHTLKYRRTAAGYSLFFSDWLVRHESTESAPFEAHK
jgi:hypothetical protein